MTIEFRQEPPRDVRFVTAGEKSYPRPQSVETGWEVRGGLELQLIDNSLHYRFDRKTI